MHSGVWSVRPFSSECIVCENPDRQRSWEIGWNVAWRHILQDVLCGRYQADLILSPEQDMWHAMRHAQGCRHVRGLGVDGHIMGKSLQCREPVESPTCKSLSKPVSWGNISSACTEELSEGRDLFWVWDGINVKIDIRKNSICKCVLMCNYHENMYYSSINCVYCITTRKTYLGYSVKYY